MKALTCQVIETNGTLAKDSSLNHPRPKPWSLLSLAFHLGFNVLLYLFLPIIPMQLMKVVQVHNYLFFYYLFLDRGEGREKERERNSNVWLPLTCPKLGIWPATQACALTGNRTDDPMVCRPALNPLSHTRQSHVFKLFKHLFLLYFLHYHLSPLYPLLPGFCLGL